MSYVILVQSNALSEDDKAYVQKINQTDYKLTTGEIMKVISPKDTTPMMGLEVSSLVENELLHEKVYWRMLSSNPLMRRYRSLKEYIDNSTKEKIQ